MQPGSPAAVVLLHGLFGWLAVPELLAGLSSYEVLAPDLPGYGEQRMFPVEQVSLESQRDFVAALIRARYGDVPVCLVGHSVGGAVAMLIAADHPDLVGAVVSIEGNFTLKDAFWSANLGRLGPDEAEKEVDELRRDPRTWVAGSIPDPTPSHVETATAWLEHQPVSTLQAMGRSIVRTTGSPDYLDRVRGVFSRVPVTLIAGERSLADWDVPEWARHQARSLDVVAGAGHLVPLERPVEVARLIAAACLPPTRPAGDTGHAV
jgi:lipase